MPSETIILVNILAVGSVLLWKTKQIPRLMAAVIAVAALILPALVRASTPQGAVLPLVAVLWISGAGRWLYQQWRAQQKRTPPRGKQREHLNADWSPKRAYDTQHEAESVAERQGHQENRTLDAYQCDVCKKWHVGHAHPGTRR
jgi:hypothetical protein